MATASSSTTTGWVVTHNHPLAFAEGFDKAKLTLPPSPFVSAGGSETASSSSVQKHEIGHSCPSFAEVTKFLNTEYDYNNPECKRPQEIMDILKKVVACDRCLRPVSEKFAVLSSADNYEHKAATEPSMILKGYLLLLGELEQHKIITELCRNALARYPWT